MTRPWIIRPATDNDISFIYSSWLKSFKHNSKLGKSMKSSVFFDNYREIIDNILLQSKVLIACSEDSPETILGYLVFEEYPNVVHYCFVKQPFRLIGIANSLIQEMSINDKVIYTHLTESLKTPIEGKYGFEYNPLYIYQKGHDA